MVLRTINKLVVLRDYDVFLIVREDFRVSRSADVQEPIQHDSLMDENSEILKSQEYESYESSKMQAPR